MEHSPAYQRFLDSMRLDYEKWHDGVGYDLDALAEMTDAERAQVSLKLAAGNDWRDVEALARIESPIANSAIQVRLSSPNVEVRLAAAQELHAKGKLPDIDRYVAEALPLAKLYGGLTRALALAEEHPTDQVKKALLWCALHHDESGIHCAALLYFLAGIAKEPFDWEHRPFFLRFTETDDKLRTAAFEELCEKIKADPKSIEPRGKF